MCDDPAKGPPGQLIKRIKTIELQLKAGPPRCDQQQWKGIVSLAFGDVIVCYAN